MRVPHPNVAFFATLGWETVLLAVRASWVAQRFSAAIRLKVEQAALAAEVRRK